VMVRRDDCPDACPCKTCKYAAAWTGLLNDCGYCGNCHNHDGYELKANLGYMEPAKDCPTFKAIEKEKEAEKAFFDRCKTGAKL